MRNNPGSRATATGLAILLLAVSTGVSSGDFGLFLGFIGVLVGANFVVVGVRRMGEEPATPNGPAVFAGVGAIITFVRRNLALVGIILTSAAVTAVAGVEAAPVLRFAMLALLLLGLCFINIRVLGD